MPRPDRYRDEDEDRDLPPRRPSTSHALIVLAVIGGVLGVGVAACGMISVLAWRSAPANPPAQPAAVVQADPVKGAKGMTRVYTRQEFRDLVTGKTPDEVTRAVGRPDETSEDGDVVRWTYRGRVRDPGPGQPAATPVVVFRAGKAAEVQY